MFMIYLCVTRVLHLDSLRFRPLTRGKQSGVYEIDVAADENEVTCPCKSRVSNCEDACVAKRSVAFERPLVLT